MSIDKLLRWASFCAGIITVIFAGCMFCVNDTVIEESDCRHTESESALRVRLANAEKERSLRSEYDYIIVNDELEAACAELRKVITS